MPDDYDTYRRNLSNYEKGLYFELGRAHELGETRDNGWVKQFCLRTKLGPRILDSARAEGRGVRGRERKSGRVSERRTLRQLNKERVALEAGQLTRTTWETVAGESLPKSIEESLSAMTRDFGARFQHVVISREDALRAMKLGQSLVSKQLELVRPYELERADRARRRLENIRRIQQEKEREQNLRSAEQARQKELTRIRTARDQLLARLPPEVARILALSMPPPERELDRHPPDLGNSTTRAGREARTREHERARDARGV